MSRDQHWTSKNLDHMPDFERGIIDAVWTKHNAYRQSFGYGYQPFYPDRFKEAIGQVMSASKKFVDVGCGPGNMLWLTKKLFPEAQVFGIELNPDFAAAAAKVCPDSTIIQEDAYTADYGAYDVVYMFNPVPDIGRLQQRVWDTLEDGAFMVSVGPRQFRDREHVYAMSIPNDYDIHRKPYIDCTCPTCY